MCGIELACFYFGNNNISSGLNENQNASKIPIMYLMKFIYSIRMHSKCAMYFIVDFDKIVLLKISKAF